MDSHNLNIFGYTLTNRKAFELLLLNTLSYFVLTFDMRAIAAANYEWSIVISVVVALLSFSILKKVQNCHGWLERWHYAIGGTIGTVTGIWITQHLFR